MSRHPESDPQTSVGRCPVCRRCVVLYLVGFLYYRCADCYQEERGARPLEEDAARDRAEGGS